VRHVHGRLLAGLLAAGAALGGCMTPTPFSVASEDENLNTKNLQRLQGQTAQRLSADSSMSPSALRFVAIGDTHDEYDDLQTAVDALNSRRDVEFVAHMGDQTNLGLLEEFEWTQEVLSDVRVPVLMTIGNHDAISSGWKIYRDMYGPYDWSFVHRGVKFVFFNSNTLEFPDTAPDRDWLLSEVEDRQGANAIVLVTHHPPITGDAGHDVSLFYRNLLAEHDITLWLHGHVADFLLKTYQDVPVLQVGTFQYHREHVVVTIDGRDVSFELCKYSSCRPVAPDGDLESITRWQP
jgi:predicted phosphodiesterase